MNEKQLRKVSEDLKNCGYLVEVLPNGNVKFTIDAQFNGTLRSLNEFPCLYMSVGRMENLGWPIAISYDKSPYHISLIANYCTKVINRRHDSRVQFATTEDKEELYLAYRFGSRLITAADINAAMMYLVRTRTVFWMALVNEKRRSEKERR